MNLYQEIIGRLKASDSNIGFCSTSADERINKEMEGVMNSFIAKNRKSEISASKVILNS